MKKKMIKVSCFKKTIHLHKTRSNFNRRLNISQIMNKKIMIIITILNITRIEMIKIMIIHRLDTTNTALDQFRIVKVTLALILVKTEHMALLIKMAATKAQRRITDTKALKETTQKVRKANKIKANK